MPNNDSVTDLPDTWHLRRLEEVADVVDSLHKTPNYSDSGIPMIRVADVRGGFLDLSQALLVSAEVYSEFVRRRVPQSGDIVFSRVGTYGNASYVTTNETFCLGQNTALISPRINSRFVHFCLESPYVKEQIENAVVGSTQKTISLRNINLLKIPIPPEPEMQAIACILGALDDKIEVNRRMNGTLEAMARALFQDWFVDFGPVRAKAAGQAPAGLGEAVAGLFPDRLVEVAGREVPEGWEIGTVENLGDVVCGKTPPTSNDEYYGGDVPFVTIPDMHNKVFVTQTNKSLSEKGASTQKAKYLPPYSICVSCIATPGLVTLTSRSCQTNQQINSVIPADPSTALYCYFALRGLGDQIRSHGAGGSVLLNVNKGQFSAMSMLLPSRPITSAFQRVTKPIFERILNNEVESESLAALLDALLPKLIAGEVRVADAERVVGRCL